MFQKRDTEFQKQDMRLDKVAITSKPKNRNVFVEDMGDWGSVVSGK